MAGSAESRAPLVSVVMSVYNGAQGLQSTLESVLGQDDCDLEFIVVDDGSTDATAEILRACAKSDPRLRILPQANAGLTLALIRGCAEARGEFIARQDAEDRSMPGRLTQQAGLLRKNPKAALVASTVRFLAPGGEWLFDSEPHAKIEIPLDLPDFRAPPLVGAMFRRSAYLRAGGFRKQFAVAQDIDLWLRLAELGPCLGLAEVHYETRMTLGGISCRRREQQLAFRNLAIACAVQRRNGRQDSPLLENYVAPAIVRSHMTGRERARFHYFIGACLRDKNRHAARRYFRQALQDDPLHFRALARWLTS